MINSGDSKIKSPVCPKCGHSDWYSLGRHRTCRPCNAEAQRRYAARQALGQGRERQSTRQARSLAESLRHAVPAPAERRRQRQACSAGHAYTAGNTALRVDSLGRQYRQCRQCHRERQRARYGLSRADSLATALGEALTERQR